MSNMTLTGSNGLWVVYRAHTFFLTTKDGFEEEKEQYVSSIFFSDVPLPNAFLSYDWIMAIIKWLWFPKQERVEKGAHNWQHIAVAAVLLEVLFVISAPTPKRDIAKLEEIWRIRNKIIR